MNKFLLILFCVGKLATSNAGQGLVTEDTLIAKTDTLHIMVSMKNHFYYYENSMIIDGSNFMVINAKGIKERIMMFLYESGRQNHQSLILLNVQKKSALNKDSKGAIKFIKQHNYMKVSLKEVEKILIEKTEEAGEDFFK